MSGPLRIGLIGNGSQMRAHYLPYLETRARAQRDIEIAWLSGCECFESERESCSAQVHRPEKQCDGRSADWTGLLDRNPVDAVVISTPNALHAAAASECLSRRLCVAVDKPTAITADSARMLAAAAESNGLVFATLAQRRFERIYRELDSAFPSLGDIRLINYVVAHGQLDPAKDLWRTRAALSGGGVLLDSAYHGIDVLLWMLARREPAIRATHVSAVADCSGVYGDEIEDSVSATVRLSQGGLLSIAASYLGPRGSVDESFLVYGTNGTARLQRHRLVNIDQSAASLTIQTRDGEVRHYDTSAWYGDRNAPLRDFVEASIRQKQNADWSLQCPAAGSVEVLAVTDAAYSSARSAGTPIAVGSPAASGIDHVALQTNDIDESVRFYVKVMGGALLSRKKFKKREMAWIDVGNTRLEVFSKRDGDELQRWSDFVVGPVHLAFRVADVGRFLEHAAAHGVRCHPSHLQPFVPVAGARPIAYLLGPDGEEVEIRDA